ncbi:general substrate transporter [Polychaeton citri CBS 116435]|uniref:General substrate transporter n=1 Tax=Polychaeton citri CBS 116435 TaxID=1314669 RepID=A0A9P4QAS2_9PEZI|nr:general substrate transporter [Polychaeton citri CBS 116435]
MRASNSHDEDAREPLIDGAQLADDDTTRGHPSRQKVNTQTPFQKTGRLVWLLTASAGISGLLFGFDTGVISSTLVSINADLSGRSLTTADKSLITAITSLLALFSAPFTGLLADKYGRKSVILVADLLFALGAAVQAVAGTVWLMVVGRALVGAAVGLASGSTPLYITELAPSELRGRLVTILSLFITGGQVVAYLVGWALASADHGWRWMVGCAVLPAILQLALLGLMPETPRYLMQVGKQNKAANILHKIYAGLDNISEREAEVDRVLDNINAEIIEQQKLRDYSSDDSPDAGQTTLSQLRRVLGELTGIPANRRALTIACMLQCIQQICGFNVLMYFSATIFTLIGFRSPVATSMSVAGTNFILTLVAFAYIDSVGRRNILLRSVPIMVLALLLCSVAFYHIPALQSSVEPSSLSLAIRHAEGSQSGFWPYVLLASLILYVAAYAIGLGCVPWQQSELFPLNVRPLGSGIATATNWSSNFVIGITFLPMMEALTPSLTFAVYAAICVGGWIGIWRIYPETAGLELEGIGKLLKDGWGVEQSVAAFEARKLHDELRDGED